eukprot:Gregarina_sp_Poly_1__1753@NODE_1452_length_4120_cov_155_009869_g963_i0_p3_GENE_NODE_1452_length_4120_cov_155_009869_g963_i0NODE_1452_length_4120_cov_155_009869_g963_i0_p3_ORF_typecomplete_len158_score19_36U3_assoc_6/PF08640_11/2e05_NODE_1452_length_4120_cov_155_009869_g963_i013831856
MKEKRPQNHGLSLPLNVRVKTELAAASKLDIFTLEECRIIAKQCRKFEHAAESLVITGGRKLVPYLEWLSYLIAVHCLLKQKLQDGKEREKLGEKRKLLEGWFNIIYRVFKKLKKTFPNDEKIDFTVAEFLVRFGSTRLFDKFVQIVSRVQLLSFAH